MPPKLTVSEQRNSFLLVVLTLLQGTAPENITMLHFLQTILDASTLSPHGYCLTWRPELIWLHVVSDTIIAIAYFSIPFALAIFVSKRQDVEFGWVFWAFAIFIMACGTTHVFSIWTLWIPDYGIEGGLKAITAIASIVTGRYQTPPNFVRPT